MVFSGGAWNPLALYPTASALIGLSSLGSFLLYPEGQLREILELLHAHDVYVSAVSLARSLPS